MPLNPGTATVATMLQDAAIALDLESGASAALAHMACQTSTGSIISWVTWTKSRLTIIPNSPVGERKRYPLENAFLYPHQSLPASADPYDEASYEAYHREDYAQTRLSNAAQSLSKQPTSSRFFFISHMLLLMLRCKCRMKNWRLIQRLMKHPTLQQNYLPHPKPRLQELP